MSAQWWTGPDACLALPRQNADPDHVIHDQFDTAVHACIHSMGGL